MSEDYLVIVDPNLLDGVAMRKARAAQEQGLGLWAGEFGSLEGIGAALALRSEALANVAAAVCAPAKDFGPTQFFSKLRTSQFPAASVDGQSAAPPSGAELLKGLGAFILRDSNLAYEELNRIPGLSAFRNVSLPLTNMDPENFTSAEKVELSDEQKFWHLEKVELERDPSAGAGMVIGIVDTGIDLNHPEFEGRQVAYQKFNDDGLPVDIKPGEEPDPNGHGTYVSSLAAGKTVGAAPGATLAVAAVQGSVLDAGGPTCFLFQLAAGTDWLITNRFRADLPGVDIINCSMSVGGLNEAIRPTIQSMLKQGILVVATVGNRGAEGVGRHGSPGNYPETLSVGATDSNDMVAQFSDWGPAPSGNDPRLWLPELSAPGVDIYGADKNKKYRIGFGTSMAAPIVTGIAVRRMIDNPSLFRNPLALRLDLLSKVAPVTRNIHSYNLGGIGRIIA